MNQKVIEIWTQIDYIQCFLHHDNLDMHAADIVKFLKVLTTTII